MRKINKKANNVGDINSRKNKQNVLNAIIRTVEKKTGLTYSQLKKEYPEDKLFSIALQYVTTTKKAVCTAFKLPIEACCRYKRHLEDAGLLVESANDVVCPYTKHLARLISTNPKEFDRLKKIKPIQGNLFDGLGGLEA